MSALSCGCRPYHLCDTPDDFVLCDVGQELYDAQGKAPLWDPEEKRRFDDLTEHMQMKSVQPESEVAP